MTSATTPPRCDRRPIRRGLLDESLQTPGKRSARPHTVDRLRFRVGWRRRPGRVGVAKRVARKQHRSVVAWQVLPEFP